ncbi:MAG: hypothetical protein HY695_17580 [Deltaproteobacteria bacterium]|nr:hypothetical protein [Deltaproteobacteria bacterium]
MGGYMYALHRRHSSLQDRPDLWSKGYGATSSHPGCRHDQTAYDYYAPKTSLIPYVNLKGIKFLLNTIAETNPKAKKLRPEAIVDHPILQEIEMSGFAKQSASGK